MKRFILSLCFMLMCNIAFAQEHWVYIRLEDRSGITSDDDKGRSKKGDIVDIVKADGTNIPSEIAKSEWAIVKVSGLTDEMIKQYLGRWEGKAYRKYRLKNIWVKNLSKGIHPQIIDVSIVNGNIRVKTNGDLSSYETTRKVYAATKPLRTIYSYIKYSFNYWVMPAYAADVSCADDSTDGVQVCTSNKSGEDYSTMRTWEDAKDGDLVSAGQIRRLDLYDDDGLDDDGNNGYHIGGSTADSTHYMHINVPIGERHSGVVGNGSSGTGFVTKKGGGDPSLSIEDDYVRVTGLAFQSYATNGALRTSNTGSIFSHIVADGNGFATRIIQQVSGGGTNDIFNIIIYNFSANTEGGVYVDSGTLNAYNVTVFNSTGRGFRKLGGTLNATNCIAMNNSGADFLGTIGGNYNASSDASSPGANSLDNKTTYTDYFIDPSSNNLILKAGSDMINAGIDDPSGGLYSDGILGNTRTSPWDIGADEFVAAVTFIPRPFMY